MLERLVEQRDAVSLVLTSTTAVKNLSAQQWVTAGELVEALRPFLHVTQEMSAASYPTLSMVLPIVDGLRHLLHASAGGLDVLRDVMVKFIDDKFGDLFADDELCAATVVDPRFKLLVFDTPTRRDRAIEVTAAASVTAAGATTTSPVASTSTTHDAVAGVPAPSIWQKLEAAKQTAPSPTAQQSTPLERARRELDLYLAEPAIGRQECPLTWWGNNSPKFPGVAAVARRLLAVPATSVPSERLFSKAGNVITKKRNSLAPSKADAVIFVMENCC